MSLLINIIEFPENCTVAESSKTFGEQGGTIGRSAENFWVLSDPDCYLSSRHSEISYENGQYVLTDLSTNGTFLNGSREPMGNGNKVQLQDGDEIELSDYKFKIKLWNTENIAPDSADPFSNNMSVDASIPQTDFMSSDPFATGDIASVKPLLNSAPEVMDPLAALDNLQGTAINASFSNDVFPTSPSHSDESDVLGQSVIWPNSHIDEKLIPEDWDLSEENDVAVLEDVQVDNNTMVDANTIQALRAENARLQKEVLILKPLQNKNLRMQEELKKIKQHFLAYQKTTKTVKKTPLNVDTTMIVAMGLPTDNLTKQKVIEINKVVGEMVRETVTGMMKVLTSRSSIKNEFRMNITTIQPVENNPLKFSANIDDALENMFLKSGSSYKAPIEAITDGFDGIAEHQVAILAGIRAAFKGAIDRFEPSVLEKRFDKQHSSSLDFLPLLKKHKNWNQFVKYFNDLTDDMDNSFQFLFGDEFVQAYEDQLQKLLIARKSKKVGLTNV